MASFEYRTFTFRNVNSSAVELDLVRDTSAPSSLASPKKTLVFFHGGGLCSGNRRSRFPGWPLEVLMRRGWLILTADYHLLPEGQVEDMINDVKHLETWILAEGRQLGIDPELIAVAGSSAGAFVSCLALASWTKLRPRAFYSLYGMLQTDSDWYVTVKDGSASFAGLPATSLLAEDSEHYLVSGNTPVWHDTTEMNDPRNRVRLFMWLLKEGKIGPLVTSSLKAATGENSPLDLITSSFPPTVAIHGTADTVVPIADSRALVAALTKSGVENQLVEVSGADHGITPQDKYHAEIEKSVDLLEAYIRS
ncbi:Alpha/Beta hydrolase protein [Lipomyces kononenkoae]|uniref:Alpha/Beta hydrolase protein n=1 Tax=Lipomyces kononenkoae TaxID=34357 RepID=A0ACC3STY1_LIPKO